MTDSISSTSVPESSSLSATSQSAATRPTNEVAANQIHWWPGSPDDRFKSLTLESAVLVRRPGLIGIADLSSSKTESRLEAWADYSIGMAATEEELSSAIGVRRDVYGKHARAIRIEVEQEDLAQETAVFVIRNLQNKIFATMRVCFSLSRETTWSHQVALPRPFDGSRLAFFERLAIRGGGIGAARAKQALFKAAFLLSLSMGTEWIVISALPPLNRLFEGLGFINVFGGERQVNVDWYPDSFYILAMDTRDTGLTLLRANRAWYEHIFDPDPRVNAALGKYFSLKVDSILQAHAPDHVLSPYAVI